jgi:LPXTG-motif cell wall-anchored protein
MRNWRQILATALLGAAAGAVTLAVPASADFSLHQSAPAPDCKTVASTLTNHPDNGHGTGGTPGAGHWADVSGTRTVKVCAVPAGPVAEKVAVQEGTFVAVVVDDGTFVTQGGAHLSPNNAMPLLANVHGKWHGGWSVKFKAPAPTSPGVWPNFTPGNLDGKEFTGAPGGAQPSTGNWVAALWTGVEFGSDVHGTADYAWDYTTCNERWRDAYNNDDGQADGPHGAGDITGLSRIPCYGNPSFTPKCDGTVVVLLTNAAPSEHSLAAYHVSGVSAHNGNVLVAGGKPGQVSVTATPDAKGVVTVTYGIGGKKQVKTFTWVKPKDCGGTPAPTTPGAPTPTSVARLPVTGPNATIYGGAAAALLLAGGALFLVARRRRIRFEA